MTTELKPCPFCGNAEVEWQESHVGFSIECYKCEYHVGGDLTLNAVTKLWNTRTEPEQGIPREHLSKMIALQKQTMSELQQKNAELVDFAKLVADGDSASIDVKAFMVHAYIHKAKELLEKMK